jgi:hypothetical protein
MIVVLRLVLFREILAPIATCTQEKEQHLHLQSQRQRPSSDTHLEGE